MIVSAASPTITTTPTPNAFTAGEKLKYTAFLLGGFRPTGTITFTLVFDGSTTVDTETVMVSGNGTYTTPTGFTPGTSSGTYQWNATYSGDANNNTASDVNDPAEQVTAIVPALTLSTTPAPDTVTLGATPVTLNDTADLEGGLDPTGTITYTLLQGAILLDTETVTVNGDGVYTTPTGFTLPSGGTATGTYQWNAVYSGDGTNGSLSDVDNPDEAGDGQRRQPDACHRPDPGHGRVGNDPCDPDRHGATGERFQPDRHDHLHAVPGYHSAGHGDGRGQRQRHLQDTDRLHPADHRHGDRHLPVERKLQRRQQQQLGQRQRRRRRAGDSQRRQPCTQAHHHPQPADTVTLGTTPVTLKDTAVLQNGYHPTGTITFTLFYNGGSTPVDTEAVIVAGNGTYTTPTGFALPSNGTVTGTYQWDATFSGDSNNDVASDNDNPDEQVMVSAASTTVVTLANPTGTIMLGTTSPTLNDMAVVAGGYNPTGTLLFTLKQDSTTVFTSDRRLPVNGNGNVTRRRGSPCPRRGPRPVRTRGPSPTTATATTPPTMTRAALPSRQ